MVERPEGQPKSSSQRKSKHSAQTEGPNAAGVTVMAVEEFVEQSDKMRASPVGPRPGRECFGPVAKTRQPRCREVE